MGNNGNADKGGREKFESRTSSIRASFAEVRLALWRNLTFQDKTKRCTKSCVYTKYPFLKIRDEKYTLLSWLMWRKTLISDLVPSYITIVVIGHVLCRIICKRLSYLFWGPCEISSSFPQEFEFEVLTLKAPRSWQRPKTTTTYGRGKNRPQSLKAAQTLNTVAKEHSYKSMALIISHFKL